MENRFIVQCFKIVSSNRTTERYYIQDLKDGEDYDVMFKEWGERLCDLLNNMDKLYEGSIRDLSNLEDIILGLMDKYEDDECKSSVLKEIVELKRSI